MSSFHSIWLMPCDDDLVYLTEIVRRLAAEFGTPAFCPHLTLVEDMPRPAGELMQLLSHHFAGSVSLDFPISAVTGLPVYYRSLFAQFEPVGRLRELKERAIAIYGKGDIGSFLPHISLAYGLEEAEKPGPIAELGKELAGRSIRFDSIAVVASAQSIPVEEWKIVGQHRLV